MGDHQHRLEHARARTTRAAPSRQRRGPEPQPDPSRRVPKGDGTVASGRSPWTRGCVAPAARPGAGRAGSMSSENREKLTIPTARPTAAHRSTRPAMNRRSVGSAPTSSGATLRPRVSSTHVAAAGNARATTAHETSASTMTVRCPVERLALSPSARRGWTLSNRTSGSASAQRAIVRATSATSAMATSADERRRDPERRRALREVVVDVVLPQQLHVHETGDDEERQQSGENAQHHVRESGGGRSPPSPPRTRARSSCPAACHSPRRVRWPSGTPPRARVMVSSSDPPRTRISTPTRVVTKYRRMSASATTWPDVPDRSQPKRKVVGGVSSANAISL